MSGFLLDTNVVSEMLKGPKANAGVVAWISSADEATLYLSVITLGEIRKGIAKIEDVKKRTVFERFIRELTKRFEGRTLDIDSGIADRWGRLAGACEVRGVKLPALDSLLAATALHANLTLVTRNVRDFRETDVALLDPWARS